MDDKVCNINFLLTGGNLLPPRFIFHDEQFSLKIVQKLFVFLFVTEENYTVGFPTGRDSATFQDKGTKVPSWSRDKGTTGQAQNQDRTGLDGLSKAA